MSLRETTRTLMIELSILENNMFIEKVLWIGIPAVILALVVSFTVWRALEDRKKKREKAWEAERRKIEVVGGVEGRSDADGRKYREQERARREAEKRAEEAAGTTNTLIGGRSEAEDDDPEAKEVFGQLGISSKKAEEIDRERDRLVINGYLQKSNTAPIRPVYSNTLAARRAQKAELKQLQVQIDPHFLYHTLYLIYRIARSDGNAAIASLSLNLSNYYRYITKMPEQIVALRDEIRHVMNYLEIQKIRFAPRISIEAQELPAEIADERIPSLIIQPIVENAFQHGVKDCVKDGLVTLRYEVDSSWFSVIVSDNSGKMTDEKVAALWAAIQQGEVQESNALRNLYRRMQLYESSGHELVLKCVNGGLTAVLTFRRRENNASITDRR